MKRDHKNRIRKDPPIRPVRQDVRQTKTAGGNFVDKLKAHRDLHAHALFSSLGRLPAGRESSISVELASI